MLIYNLKSVWKGCLKMNYTDIAKFVHDSVKNPHKNNLASTQLKDHDVKIIKKVF